MNAKSFVLVCDGMNDELFKKLQNISELEVHPKAKNKPEEIAQLKQKANALVIRSATTCDAAFLENCPNLKLIIRAGEGTDNIDKKYCQANGIKVANTPGANNNSAAEHAVALMMTVLRKTALANQTMHAGHWNKNSYNGNELTGKTVGIIGFGRIGQILARRISGFEPEILFYDPMVTATPTPNATKVDTLDELLKKSDIISLHLPLLDSTKNLIKEREFSLMKPTAIFINASRGKIVDENALAAVLKNKIIRGAGFDVFAQEPLQEDSPLRGLENLVMTPHLGASTEEAEFRVGEMTVHQLKEFFVKNNLLNEVKA